ncbi:MAG: DNA primase [Spirochaetes bacterium]|nr:DNA primase [Spirochaetota bacterium]
MSLISKLTIQEINNRLDAIAVIGDYVRLEKKSGRWWGRCPFHAGGQEKTPSFKVDPDLKMYHCFGCGKGGSVIGFVMEVENLTYPEALKNLAGKMGIEIVYEEGSDVETEDNSIKDDLYELYSRTTKTFQYFLNEKPEGQNALKYLSERGINREMSDCFKLGFAPADREFLFNFLKQKSYSDDFLGKSGLFSSKYKTISLFSGRLIFPITDRQGKIVAFGGRAMPGVLQNDGSEPPKYINSPETEIYKKGQTLFAIDQAKSEMRKTKTAVIAEGYIDVIALHQAGVKNAVAPLGTAFTDEQASWLRRQVENVTLVFDNDEAGQKAAYKAIITCRKNGLSCSLVNVIDALKTETGAVNIEKIKDPADILQKFGAEILKKIINCTINDFEYLVSLGTSSSGGNITRAAEFLFPYLDALDSEVERDDCTARLADAIRTERVAVQKDYSLWKKDSTSRAETVKQDIYPEHTVRRNAELVLLTVIAVNMELYGEFRATLEIKEIDDRDAKELFIALEECYQHGESGMDFLLARIKNEQLKNFIISHGDSPEFKGGSLNEKDSRYIAPTNPRRLMEDGINEIRKKKLRRRLIEIGAELRSYERKADTDINIDDLLTEKKDIDSQIRKLEGR